MKHYRQDEEIEPEISGVLSYHDSEISLSSMESHYTKHTAPANFLLPDGSRCGVKDGRIIRFREGNAAPEILAVGSAAARHPAGGIIYFADGRFVRRDEAGNVRDFYRPRPLPGPVVAAVLNDDASMLFYQVNVHFALEPKGVITAVRLANGKEYLLPCRWIPRNFNHATLHYNSLSEQP